MDNNDEIINLADYMTLQEAAAVLHKSTKQVRRYIQQRRLKAIMLGNMYYISRSSVSTLATQPVQIEDTLSRQLRQLRDDMSRLIDSKDRQLDEMYREIVQKIDELGRQIDALNDELNELKTRSAPPAQAKGLDVMGRQEDKATRQTARRDEQEPYVILVSSPEELPEDAIPLIQVAEEEDINRKTFSDYVRQHKIEHYGIRQSPRDIRRYFTGEQRATIRDSRKWKKS